MIPTQVNLGLRAESRAMGPLPNVADLNLPKGKRRNVHDPCTQANPQSDNAVRNCETMTSQPLPHVVHQGGHPINIWGCPPLNHPTQTTLTAQGSLPVSRDNSLQENRSQTLDSDDSGFVSLAHGVLSLSALTVVMLDCIAMCRRGVVLL